MDQVSNQAAAYEALPAYAGSEPERLRLVQSIVAMSNTAGGRIVIRVVGNAVGRDLDAPALARLVNRHAAPVIHVELEDVGDGVIGITVPASDRKPHVIVESGRYGDNGTTHHVFHRGQIWVRRRWGNVEATPDDLHGIILDASGRLLERLGAQIRRPGFLLHEGGPAQPVRLVSDPDAPLVRADLDALFPLTRQKLCDEFGRPYGWIAAAVKRLGVEGSAELAYADRNSAGHPTRWRYAESVRDSIAARLATHPDWDPIHQEPGPPVESPPVEEISPERPEERDHRPGRPWPQ